MDVIHLLRKRAKHLLKQMAGFNEANYSNFSSYIIKIMLNLQKKKRPIISCGYNGVWLVNNCSSEYPVHVIEHGTQSEYLCKSLNAELIQIIKINSLMCLYAL